MYTNMLVIPCTETRKDSPLHYCPNLSNINKEKMQIKIKAPSPLFHFLCSWILILPTSAASSKLATENLANFSSLNLQK
jgi:hypothetical protein